VFSPRRLLALSLLAAFPLHAFCATEEGASRTVLSLNDSTTVSAGVVAIDHETRVVTLDLGDGATLTFTAEPEVRNLDQVEVGDVVRAEYVRSFTAQLRPNDGREPEASEAGAMARSEEGAMPGMVASGTRVVTATVESIDLEENRFELRVPDGPVRSYSARNPDNLRLAEVGDLVVLTLTETVAIAVEEGERVP